MSLYTRERKGKDTIDNIRKENAKRDDDKEKSYCLRDMIDVIFKLYRPRNDAMSFVDNALIGTVTNLKYYVRITSGD